MNYPLLRVERNYGLGTVTLTQSRFAVDADADGAEEEEDLRWHIPLTYSLVSGDAEADFSNEKLHGRVLMAPEDEELR